MDIISKIQLFLLKKDRVKEILISGMESAAKLLVPLKVEVEEGKNWYEAK